MRSRLFGLSALPYWAAILPLATITTTYVVAASVDHVAHCIPYLTGCTSVSSTGRMAPESLIFRAGLLPTAVVLILFWHRCAMFLDLNGDTSARVPALRIVGVVLGLSLMLYALTLGFEESVYPRLRRIGMSGFAIGTFVAKLLFIFGYKPLRRGDTARIWLWLVALCAALPILDLVSEIVKLAGVEGNSPDHVATWNAFVAASAYYLLVGKTWWRHGFVSECRIAPG
jgi:hypothetical protein